MEFTYTLNSIGWATVYLKIGNSEIYITPSYLSKSLTDLVRSIEVLLPECTAADEVQNIVRFDWNSEPAIDSWKIQRISQEKIKIEIMCYKDGIETAPGELVFREECKLIEFITEVVRALEALLEQHGIIGYRKQWCAEEFPLSSYLQLKHFLLNKSGFPLTIHNPDEWLEKIESKLQEELKLIKKITL